MFDESKQIANDTSAQPTESRVIENHSEIEITTAPTTVISEQPGAQYKVQEDDIVASAELAPTTGDQLVVETFIAPMLALTFFDIVYDTMKVGQKTCSVVEIPLAAICGCLCWLAELLDQKERDNRPATRREVLNLDNNREQIRRNEAQQLEIALTAGEICGVCVPRTVGNLMALPVGLVRGAYYTLFGELNRNDKICCYSREEIQDISFFSPV